MKNVTYINAGAGSGKTYTLIDRLTKLIAKKEVEPEQVILTTFTTKAANEFKEKAKAKLYESGLFEEASRLDEAMIGTVHSVCQRMIGKYWFNIGLAPEMGVMAQEDTDFYMSQSLADLPNEEEIRVLHNFAKMFAIVTAYRKGTAPSIDYDFWVKDLETIIGFSTNYEISDFKRSEEESLNFIRQFVDQTCEFSIDPNEIEAVLNEHEAFLSSFKQSKANDDRLKMLRNVRRHLGDLTIKDLQDLEKTIGTPSKYGPLASAYKESFQKVWRSPMVYDMQAEVIHIIFELARRWQVQFSEFKKEKNLLDYNDMEKYMHQLVNNDQIAKEISKSYKYLFVDEFQDSSPIQVKIFDKLSDMMVRSFWVGDYKQAIYGFRGSATALTKSVVDRINDHTDGCDSTSLGTSYRSLPDIVTLNNHLFEQAFKEMLPRKNIVLEPHRKEDNCEHSLRYMAPSAERNIACHIAKLIKDGAKANEIAVLARKNDTLDKISDDLKRISIPSSREDVKVTETAAYNVVEPLLSIIENENDSLAKASVANQTDMAYSTGRLIDDRLQFLRDEERTESSYLTDVETIAKALALRPRLRQQSVAAMVESLIIELGLYDRLKSIDDSSFASSCLDTIISAARAYEEHCVQLNMPSTISGFKSYIETIAPTGSGDPDGVQLHTYHSSKGLQWKYVVLTSLDDSQCKQEDIIKKDLYGVHFEYAEEPSRTNPYPEVYIRLARFVYGGNNSKLPDTISSVIAADARLAKAEKARKEEASRLLYVGMTRPKDVLLIDVSSGKKGNALQWFKDVGIGNIVSEIPEDASRCEIFGDGLPFDNYTITDEELDDMAQSEDESRMAPRVIKTPDMRHEEKRPPRHLSPSGQKGKSRIGKIRDFSTRIPLNGHDAEMAAVGDCIHQIFAGMEEKRSAPGPSAGDIIRSYGLEGALTDAEAVSAAWRRLAEYLESEHGEAVRTYHERPFRHEKDGQLTTGSIDLVWQTRKGDILVDFKTCPMGADIVRDEKSEHYAGLYGGQLDAYTSALEAAGETVLARYIYYPVSGLIVEVTREAE